MAVFRKIAVAALALGGAGAAIFWWLTVPERLAPDMLAALGTGDTGRGQRIFDAGGCASCHARPKSEGDARLQLAGGVELKTQFGTFVAPNISSDPNDGIGAWSLEDFANAMLKGVSREGQHLYPAFPYASYARMKPADVADLYAFLKTLPAVEGRAPDHELGFPFNIRRGLGLWKQLYLSDQPVVAFAEGTPDKVLHGRDLVEGAGHCGECHTPRSLAGGTEKGQWLAGARAAEGDGVVPNITPEGKDISGWSEADIAGYLETGFTPEFDSVGGTMVEVQKNMARLTAADREAIAAYLKAIPPQANGYPAQQPKPAG
ncbi:cytochrome c [Aminobacter sp. NyZ550]|jgi:mono/diheme cytochrome c family protein|uniref:cytochrome c n=1 Tax=unclassified Aminobacter TaxID=2644704 RepID=UPI0017841B71|nr:MULTISPECIES: cytochrome c [unclassified Aminobacter]QOF72818.1 c-type cytochrome [Aminobacter sp. SR38]WAX94592.1 cytochrome c [Aminobacter sp. NyZ550]